MFRSTCVCTAGRALRCEQKQNSAVAKFPQIRRQRKSWQLQVHGKIPIEIKNQFFLSIYVSLQHSNYVYILDVSIWEFPLLVADAWENRWENLSCSRRCWCHCGSGRTSRCSVRMLTCGICWDARYLNP